MSDPMLEKRDNNCFISYASEDGALAQRIANWLGEAGLRIWFVTAARAVDWRCQRSKKKPTSISWAAASACRDERFVSPSACLSHQTTDHQ
jgi:hypothetical protein